jgi:hypothetical protein
MMQTNGLASQNTSLALNANHDLYLDASGNVVLVTGVEAVAQDCQCAMAAQLGEMIYEPQNGLPYLTDVFLQTNLVKWEAAARTAISAVPSVVQLKSISYSIANNALSYVATIQTIYSQFITVSDTVTGSVA